MNAKLPILTIALALLLGSCGQSTPQATSQQNALTPAVTALSDLPQDPYAVTGLSEQGRSKTSGTTTTTTSPASYTFSATDVPTSTQEADIGTNGKLVNVGTGAYTITLAFAQGSATSVVDAMIKGAQRWSTIITGDLPNISVNIPAGSCGSNAAYTGTVDDILVFTGSKSIDGTGNILAQSGPCSIRSTGGQTIYATLIFDSADLANYGSLLPAVATHELGHSLGIGSLWSHDGLTTGSGSTDPRYLGSNGNREYAALGGTLGNIPEENTGGQGTAESHWRETTFGNEMMTGFISSSSNPLSRMSIGGLADLGYSVDYSKADSYSSTSMNTLDAHGLDIAGHEQVLRPKWQVK